MGEHDPYGGQMTSLNSMMYLLNCKIKLTIISPSFHITSSNHEAIIRALHTIITFNDVNATPRVIGTRKEDTVAVANDTEDVNDKV